MTNFLQSCFCRRRVFIIFKLCRALRTFSHSRRSRAPETCVRLFDPLVVPDFLQSCFCRRRVFVIFKLCRALRAFSHSRHGRALVVCVCLFDPLVVPDFLQSCFCRGRVAVARCDFRSFSLDSSSGVYILLLWLWTCQIFVTRCGGGPGDVRF